MHLDTPAPTAQSDRMSATSPRLAEAAISGLHPLLRSLFSKPYPAVMGVLNVTPDSFRTAGNSWRPIVPSRRRSA